MSRGYIRAKEKYEAVSDEENDSLDRKSLRGFTPAQVQNSQAARVYVFGQNDIYDNEETEIEMSEIRSRKSNRSNGTRSSTFQSEPDNIFFDRKINEDDTLASISLQYACPISELKRLNKLIQDQDFFALTSIKVPIKRYGVLSEMLEKQELGDGVCASGASSVPKGSRNTANGGASCALDTPEYMANSLDDESDNYLSDPERQNLLIRTLSIRDNIRSQSKEAEEFLNSMDKDLQNIRKSTNSYKPSLRDVTYTLTDKRIQPLKKESHWIAFGLSWRQIVVVAIVITLVVPLLTLAGYCYQHSCLLKS